MIARILGRKRVWLVIGALVAPLLAVYFVEGHIAREITGTLVFDCDEGVPLWHETCREELPSDGYIRLVDITGKRLQYDENYFHHIAESNTVAEGAITGTDRRSPAPFSIEFYPKDIDPDGDYIILASFSYRTFLRGEHCCYRGADFRNLFERYHPPTRVLTKGHPSKNVVVNLKGEANSLVVVT